jgi:hypothetical protein
MDDRMDGWVDGWTGHMKKLHEKWPRHPLLYVMADEKQKLQNEANETKQTWVAK